MLLHDLLPQTPFELNLIPEDLSSSYMLHFNPENKYGSFNKRKVNNDISGIRRIHDLLIGFYCNEDIEFDIVSEGIFLGRQKVLKNTLSYPIFGIIPLCLTPFVDFKILNFTKNIKEVDLYQIGYILKNDIIKELYSSKPTYLADYQLDKIQKLKFIIEDGGMKITYSKNIDSKYELLSIPKHILVV